MKHFRFFYEADSGAGSGAQPGDTTGTNGGSQPQTFTQADVDRIVQERLRRAEEKAAEATRKAQQAAEEKALKENQQFKELSERQAADLAAMQAKIEGLTKDFESIGGSAERYKTALETHVKAQRKGLPDPICALLDNLDPVAQMEWLTKNAATLTNAGGAPPPTPRANGSMNDAAIQQAKAQFERTVRNL